MNEKPKSNNRTIESGESPKADETKPYGFNNTSLSDNLEDKESPEEIKPDTEDKPAKSNMGDIASKQRNILLGLNKNTPRNPYDVND